MLAAFHISEGAAEHNILLLHMVSPLSDGGIGFPSGNRRTSLFPAALWSFGLILHVSLRTFIPSETRQRELCADRAPAKLEQNHHGHF